MLDIDLYFVPNFQYLIAYPPAEWDENGYYLIIIILMQIWNIFDYFILFGSLILKNIQLKNRKLCFYVFKLIPDKLKCKNP